MVHRIIDRAELKQTEPQGYEFVVGPFDYHIRFEEEVGSWVLDQFRHEVKGADEAHVRSVEVESLNDGVHYALEETW